MAMRITICLKEGNDRNFMLELNRFLHKYEKKTEAEIFLHEEQAKWGEFKDNGLDWSNYQDKSHRKGVA